MINLSYLVFLLTLSQTYFLKVQTPLTKKFCLKALSIVIFIPFLATMLRVQIATATLFFFFWWDCNPEDCYFQAPHIFFSVNTVSSNLCLWILLISPQHVI